ncbi:hypothetical protein [Gimesia fumaroli]|uniref:hypothetical protein n=1 Tax=Gimesia fumaroli TaxID=2527976 RepID=UPI0011A2E93B|nr:hypothetical protein [Gimesia fumaroli]
MKNAATGADSVQPIRTDSSDTVVFVIVSFGNIPKFAFSNVKIRETRRETLPAFGVSEMTTSRMQSAANAAVIRQTATIVGGSAANVNAGVSVMQWKTATM